jgi:putative ABC transport system permease protein
VFIYYVDLALHSFRRHKVLTALMSLAISLGIGASVTMLTVLHNLAGNPLPQRSNVLFHPQIDPRSRDLPGASKEPPDNLTYTDAVNLFQLTPDVRRVMTSSNTLPTRAETANTGLALYSTRATTSDFFSMFDVPFLYGSGWTAEDGTDRAQVVVLSRKLNNRLFNGANSVGKDLEIATKFFRVIGVVDTWNPQPHFYDLSTPYGDAEEMYMPFNTWLDLPQDYGYGPMKCWGKDPNAGTHNPKAPECTWVQYWVQLSSSKEVAHYTTVLNQYSSQQRQLGRFERAPNVRLDGMLDWLDYKHVVPVTVRMQAWIAFGVLLICIVNTISLMVVKFIRKSGEIGIRRALGASRKDIFWQCLTEAALIGVTGGLIGLPLAWIGLWMVHQQPVEFASSAHLDMSMLVTALILAVLASLCAGVWPAWRASRLAPALQVKAQ